MTPGSDVYRMFYSAASLLQTGDQAEELLNSLTADPVCAIREKSSRGSQSVCQLCRCVSASARINPFDVLLSEAFTSRWVEGKPQNWHGTKTTVVVPPRSAETMTSSAWSLQAGGCRGDLCCLHGCRRKTADIFNDSHCLFLFWWRSSQMFSLPSCVNI